MSTPVAGYAVMPIVPSLRGLDAEINRQLNGPGKAAAKKAGTEAGKAWRDSFGELNIDSSSLNSFGIKAVALGGVAALGIGKATKAAGDLNAAVSTSEQVFGGAATAIQEWSQGSADAIGLSQRAAIEAATSFATFGKSAGLGGEGLTKFSTDLTAMAADLAAFKNTSVEDALGALQSGLAGESEPLRRYGILLNDAQLRQEALRLGITKTTSDALTPQQRVLAANELIFRQGADAIGQFTRESDELTTQGAKLKANWEDAQAALGESLLPALTSAAQAANSALKAFQGLDDGTQGFLAKLAVGGAGASVLVGGLSLAAGAGMKLQDAYGRMRAAADNGNRVMGVTATTAKTAGKALGAAGLAFAVYELGEALDEASKDAVGFETALNNIGNAAAGANIDAYIADLAKSQEGWQDVVGDVWTNIGNLGMDGPDSLQIGEYSVEFDELAAALERAKAAGADDQLARMLERIAQAEPPEFNSWFDSENEGNWLDLQEAIAGYEKYLKSAGVETEGYAAATDQQAAASDDAKASSDALSKAVDNLGRRTALASLEFDAGAAAASAFGDALERSTSVDNLLGAGLGVSSAMRDLKTGFFGEADAAKDAASETDSLSDALDRMNRALAWSDPALSAASISLGSLAAAGEAFRESMTGSMSSQIGSALDLGDAFRDFSKQMRRLPDEIDVAGAALGKYKPRQTEAIRAMLQLGDATNDYLSRLLESGKGSAHVRSEADRLRNAYIEQLRAAGKSEEQIRQYIETLGLTPEQVETKIKLSGEAAARFEVESWLQLLEGRIPESVAVSVGTLISSGNLEGAADALEQLAKSNPVVIPVDLDKNKIDEAKEELLELPRSFDPAIAAFGGYTEAQEKGLQAVLDLGDATKAYLQELVGAGKYGEAISEADRLREAYRLQFEQFGITGSAFDEYADKLLGLDPVAIQVGIDMAQFESDAFRVQTLLGLLEADMSSEDRFAVAAKIRTGDIDGALEILNQKITDWEAEQEGLKVWADFEEANKATAEFIEGIVGTPAEIPLGVEKGLAFEGVNEFRVEVQDGQPVFVPVDSDTNPAKKSFDLWRLGAAGMQTDTKLGADTTAAKAQVYVLEQDWKGTPRLVLVDADTTLAENSIDAMLKRQAVIAVQLGGSPSGDQSGLRRASGGYVSGPGTSTSDSIMAWLSNGEYVLQASAVRDIGVDTLDRLNRGDIDVLKRADFTSTSSSTSSGPVNDLGGVEINYHQVERAPTARDLVRGLDDELMLLTGSRFGR